MTGFCLAIALSILWYGTAPLYGDEIGYGYSAASWIERNSMALIPSGEARGEQAMGHPALFFWLWAALIRVFGNTTATARILPTLATGFALTGIWRLGTGLSGRNGVGVMATLGLLASPLFLAQTFRAMPESAHLACVAWSFFFFVRGRRFQAALLAVLATIFRQQGLFLGAAFLLAELHSRRRLTPGLLLWFTPLLVPLVTGLLNLAVNGYFFFPSYLGESSPDLQSGWLQERMRLFAGHLLTEDFRWFPVGVAVAYASLGEGRSRPGLLFLAPLALPALLQPAVRLGVIMGFVLLYCLVLLARKRLPSPPVLAMLVFLGLLVAFHVLIVAVAPDPALNLFRYVIGGYPVIMALLAMGTRRAGKAASWVVWGVFCVASATCMTTVRRPWQPDATIAGMMEAQAMKRAIASVGNPYHPDGRVTAFPALGYVSTPLATEPEGVIDLLLVTADRHQAAELLPEGYRFTGRTSFLWTHEGLSVTALEAVPR